MEMHELDNRIKRALLCKTNEILPSEETFKQILAGLEKQKAHRTLNISYKHYIIALICVATMIFGATSMLSVDTKSSAMEIINIVKSVFISDNNKVFEKNPDEVKHATSDNTQPGNADIFKKMGVNALFIQTFAGCFLLNQVYDLELCLRFLLIGRMTLGQTWYYNK